MTSCDALLRHLQIPLGCGSFAEMAAATTVQTKARVKKILEQKDVEIKTKAVEQSLLPLIEQVSLRIMTLNVLGRYPYLLGVHASKYKTKKLQEANA